MKVLANKVWNEPAAFIGLMASIALAVGAVLADSEWTWETIVAVTAPLLTGLGIRQTVTPVHSEKGRS